MMPTMLQGVKDLHKKKEELQSFRIHDDQLLHLCSFLGPFLGYFLISMNLLPQCPTLYPWEKKELDQ